MHTMIPKIVVSGPSPPEGPVDFVGSGTTNIKSGSGTTQTFSHTRPVTTKGSLVVKSMNETPVSGVTYNGVALDKIIEEGFGGTGASFWMGNNTDMATGSNNVVITFTGSTSDAVARVENLKNVDQSTMSDANNGISGNLASSSLNITIAEDGLAMDCIAHDFFDMTTTGGGSQITLSNNNDANLETASSYNNVQTAGSKTLGWTWFSDGDTGHVEVSVKNG